jgi:steroid delta-isomerase-like uncharacterized protein
MQNRFALPPADRRESRMPYEVVEKFAAGWSSHDPDELAAIFTDDCFYEDVVLNVAARGPEDVKQFLRDWLTISSDLNMRLTKQFGMGDAAGAEWIFTGTHDGQLDELGPTGKRFEFRGATLFEFKDDRITGCIDYWDMATLRRMVQ